METIGLNMAKYLETYRDPTVNAIRDAVSTDCNMLSVSSGLPRVRTPKPMGRVHESQGLKRWTIPTRPKTTIVDC